ncbi:MAG: 5'-methylthioadenosine/adenosylhomocysteine nucleosidase [Tatlockia sp.]|nr:5'-methylthioadenosine/adenosylhomocysteine nucleosidase [Tatlockia sp.]
MKIGILGAMLEEVSSIKNLMVIEKESTIANREFLEGKIGDVEVVLTFSRWGKVASASTTTILINKFDVDFVIFTGVAGAVNEQLNIGDVVISNGLYQHDMDARPFFDQFQIPLTSTIIFKPKEEDIEKARLASETFLNKIDSVIKGDLLTKYSICKPKVLTGLIASGDKFVCNPNEHENINLTINENQTLAVEMEGAAVAQVCEDHTIPYVIVRTISDKADHSAVVDFKGFIQDIACTYSSEIVKEYLTPGFFL